MSRKKLNAQAVINELSGQSVFFNKSQPTPPQKKKFSKKPPEKTNLRTPEVPKSRTSEVTKSGTSVDSNLRTYELRNFDELRRLDIRLTFEQKRFLDDLEESIRQEMPEGEQGNPEHKRITKNSIIRVFVEIFRQLNLKIKATKFKNENDLMNDLFNALLKELPKFRTSEVTDLQTSFDPHKD